MNVLSIYLQALRHRYRLRCAASALSIATYTLLLCIDWRLALAVFMLDAARVAATRADAIT